MADLSDKAKQTLKRLLNSSLKEARELSEKDFRSRQMTRLIPEDLNPPPEGPYLIVTGESYGLYYEALLLLATEPALEYLKQDKIDELLWHLLCACVMAKGSERTVQGNKNRLKKFVQENAKPIIEYEILVPVDHLDAAGTKFSVQAIAFIRMPAEELRAWGIPEKGVNEFKDRTFALTKERGTDPLKAIGRVRGRAAYALDVVVAGLAARRMIRDEELMFELSEVAYYKEPGGEASGWWQRAYKPIDLSLAGESDKLAHEIGRVTAFLDSPQVSQEMKDRLTVCLANLRKAARSSSFDDKVNFLFSGLESLFQIVDDQRKGEAIAARLALLSSEATGGFFDPTLTLALYELRRSKTIHGEEFGIAHEKEYDEVLVRTNEAIRAFIDIVSKENLKNRAALFKWLRGRGMIPKLIDWLKRRDSPTSRGIIEWLEKEQGKT